MECKIIPGWVNSPVRDRPFGEYLRAAEHSLMTASADPMLGPGGCHFSTATLGRAEGLVEGLKEAERLAELFKTKGEAFPVLVRAMTRAWDELDEALETGLDEHASLGDAPAAREAGRLIGVWEGWQAAVACWSTSGPCAFVHHYESAGDPDDPYLDIAWVTTSKAAGWAIARLGAFSYWCPPWEGKREGPAAILAPPFSA